MLEPSSVFVIITDDLGDIRAQLLAAGFDNIVSDIL